jgi:hypothetical protein
MHRNGAAACIHGGRTLDLAAPRIAVLAHRTDAQLVGEKRSQVDAIATPITGISAAPFSSEAQMTTAASLQDQSQQMLAAISSFSMQHADSAAPRQSQKTAVHAQPQERRRAA